MTFDFRAGLSRWEETTGSIFGSNFDQRTLGIDPGARASVYPHSVFRTSILAPIRRWERTA